MEIRLFSANVPAESTEEYFKSNITIPFLDCLVSEMETHFSEQNRGAIVGIFSLIPKVAVVKQPNIHDLSYYKDDLPSFSSLEAEVEHWCFQWKTRASISTPLPDNLICSLPHADADIIRVLIEIGCIFPVSSSEAERSFSVLRIIKTNLRNRLGEDRLAAFNVIKYQLERGHRSKRNCGLFYQKESQKTVQIFV